MTGCRVSAGGAQELLDIRPDITCLGKIIGGGLPVGAYGASREVMGHVAPAGDIYQAGTLSGNPLATAAGLAVMEQIAARGHGLYRELDAMSARLEAGLRAALSAAAMTGTVNRAGSMLTLFIGADSVTDYASAKKCDTALFAAFFHAMLDRGIYLPPSQFECWFVSAAHTAEDVDQTVTAARDA